MLSGTFMQSAYQPDPNQAVQHTADPGHGKVDEVETNPVWQAPPYPETETGPPVIGMEYVGSSMHRAIDRTPVTHEARSLPNTENRPASQRLAGDAHADDFGADDAVTLNEPPLQLVTERYDSARFQGLGNEGIEPSEAALRRGLNAEPQNNPPVSGYLGYGFRRGFQDSYAVRRRFNPPPRYHEPRIVTPDTATTITENAPPVGGDGVVAQPFGSLQRFLSRLYARPQLRREPPPWDQDVMVAQTDQAAAQQPEGVGTGWVAV
jgi:hypothetical protein